MKLTFKDLKQEKFVIEVEPSETVREVKQKIAQEKGEYEAERMKVIYSGKILQDDKTVESYNIQEKDFLVCLPSKGPKPAASASSAVSASSAAPATPAPRTPAATPAAPAPAAPAPASSTPVVPATPTPAGAQAQPAAFGDPSALAMGSAAEGAVTEMEAMGFARSDIDRAMRAAFYNPDRAIDYLLNGIPENIQREQQQAQQQQQQDRTPAPAPAPSAEDAAAAAALGGDEGFNMFEAAAQAGEGGGRGNRSGGGESLANLDFLRQNPHFQQLRQLVQQQPHMLEPILQQVAAGNPQIAQIIGQNSDQFLQLLSEDLEDDEAALPPGTQAISVTEEERDAIERLCRLGFPRDSVIQAYFACDKNEELAANFLFDQPDDDEE
ncbi:UV excision repair protein (RadW) [Penicillium argentinense]|uniref:UV excision repair protein RAD23 n=1 Tax=Penicillium argentinense TaxID=1131581 RepID=A0A9W9F7K8_9EURO|nr:UV excision repair protein (RadW) [Penicillium argentinense]KAJ5095090.1 UV excision repair protein (RadW) [Penicillium argentinense]